MHHGDMMGGFGGMGSWWMWLHMLVVTFGWVAVVALLWRLGRRGDGGDALAILKRRLAAGEISTEEYTQKRELLK